MRINHANLSRTIVYGTAAKRISDPPSADATHRWKVYVRGYRNADTSYFIRSVTFKIHETFMNPTRIVEKPPFEVEEVGWGEFTVQGKIYFTDTHEKPAYFILFLKLHRDPNNRKIGDVDYDPESVVNERMDTIIFESPTEITYRIIKSREEGPLSKDTGEQVKRERENIEKAITYVISKLEGEEKYSLK